MVQQLLAVCPVPLQLSVSATTRAPRQGEQDGRDYHFLSRGGIPRRREEGEFLECKEVFGRGDWYGTLRSEVTTGHAEGKWVLLEIDVAGALAVLQQVPDAITIFIHPGSLAELEKRLRVRGTEDAEVAGAPSGSRSPGNGLQSDKYQYEVINDTVERAVTEICEILKRSWRMTACSKN